MSQENVDSSKRAVDAFNRRDLEAWLQELDPEVELHLALFVMFGGQATVYRGHDGVPKRLCKTWRTLSPSFRSSSRKSRTLASELSRSAIFTGAGGQAGPKSSPQSGM